MTNDHYATLGVPPTAKAAAIRSAYLALMREYHPDRNPDPAAALHTQAVIAAFKVLGDFDRRNHYDWGRRREREAAQAAMAAAARRPRRAWAVGAGVIGLAAFSAWLGMPEPTPTPTPATADPKFAEMRDLPVAEVKPMRKEPQAAAHDTPNRPVDLTVKTRKSHPAKEDTPRTAPQVASAAPRTTSISTKPKVAQAPVVQEKALKGSEARAGAKPATVASEDLASLDQFVMGFYGQSWRVGDAPKRAALEQSRAAFAARRGGCSGESCKRDAYLKLMRDVSTIVESGQPQMP